MTDAALREALAADLHGMDGQALSAAVRRLVIGYRAGDPLRTPRLDDAVTAAAYAAYRMPATYAAVRAAVSQLPDRSIETLVDLGGGTGAAAWAVAEAVPSVSGITVWDRSTVALDLGRRLAHSAPYPAVRAARWQRADAGQPLPAADLVTVSYLLGELTPAEQERTLVTVAAGRGAVLVVEPGTPAGYRRVLEARALLIAAGHRVLAPCPHSEGCPLARATDWCHFGVRLDRSALHRRLKGGELGYEDEKFAYVATARDGDPAAGGRVLRHPQTRKGLVTLTVCRADGQVAPASVGRSHTAYRAARDTRWGDPWPPADTI